MNISPTQLPIINTSHTRDDVSIPQNALVTLGFSDVVDNRSINHIQEADRALQNAGYKFIGYHGTNLSNMRSMCETGMDPKFCGSGDGQAKGSGFYIARSVSMAMDYAEASTQAGDPQPPLYETPHNLGEKGVSELVRVYAKNFDGFEIGKDIAWGISSSDGDPHGNRRVTRDDTEDNKLKNNQKDLELVISPSNYDKLAVLPSLHTLSMEDTLSPMHKWPSHTSVW